MADKPKRGIFRSLRRGGSGDLAKTAAEEGAMWAAHQRATASVREAGEAAQRIASHVAKQRGTVDALSDRARAVSARAQELGASFGRIVDAFARLEFVALNAGLESARLGEGMGAALGLFGEEVRGQASRGSEAARELSTAFGEIGVELVQVHGSVDRARDTANEMAQEAARVGGASSDAERALADVNDRLKKATGSDPETARALAEVTEHARALVTAFGTLSGKMPSALIRGALRPVLEPLARFLEGDGAEG